MENIFTYSYNLEEEAIDVLTELEFRLSAHPERSVGKHYFVKFQPPRNTVSDQDDLEQLIEEAEEIGKDAGNLADELEGQSDRRSKKMRFIESYSAQLIVDAGKMTETEFNIEWAYNQVVDGGFKSVLSHELDYTPEDGGYIRG